MNQEETIYIKKKIWVTMRHIYIVIIIIMDG